jgi:hypothetical protein
MRQLDGSDGTAVWTGGCATSGVEICQHESSAL